MAQDLEISIPMDSLDPDLGLATRHGDQTVAESQTMMLPPGITIRKSRPKKRTMQQHGDGDDDGQDQQGQRQRQGQAYIHTGGTFTRSRKRPRTAEEEQEEQEEAQAARARGGRGGGGHPYKCLAPDTWLNDTPIHDILQDLAVMSDGAFVAVDPLTTTGYGRRAPRRLQEQLSKHPAAALLIPLHLERDRHWLLVVARSLSRRLDIYDSLFDARSPQSPSTSCLPVVHKQQRVKTIRDALAGLWARLSRLHEHDQDQDHDQDRETDQDDDGADDKNPWRWDRWTVTFEPCAPQPNMNDCGTSVIISACLAVAAAAAPPAQVPAHHGVGESALSSLLLKQPDWILWRRLAAWWIEARLDRPSRGRPRCDIRELHWASDVDVDDPGPDEDEDDEDDTTQHELAMGAVSRAQLLLTRRHESALAPGSDKPINVTVPGEPVTIGRSPRSANATATTVVNMTHDALEAHVAAAQALVDAERRRQAQRRQELCRAASAIHQLLQALISRAQGTRAAVMSQNATTTAAARREALGDLLDRAARDLNDDAELVGLLGDRLAAQQLRERELRRRAALVGGVADDVLRVVASRSREWLNLLMQPF